MEEAEGGACRAMVTVGKGQRSKLSMAPPFCMEFVNFLPVDILDLLGVLLTQALAFQGPAGVILFSGISQGR